MDQFNLNRQAAKTFYPGDIVEKEDGSPFTDPHSRKKYQRAKISAILMDQMILKPVDESGVVVDTRYNGIHIARAQYSSLKIVVPWNSRNARRRRNEQNAANARIAQEELERQRAHDAQFHPGQVVAYTINDYDNYMGQQGALLGTYRFPATILEIIPGAQPRAQIRYNAADGQPAAPGWVASGVITKTVGLNELAVGPVPPFAPRVASSPRAAASAPRVPAPIRNVPVNEDPAPPSPGGGTRKSKRSKRKTRRRRAI